MDKFSTQEGSLNCKNISKCGKKWKLKYGIVASTFDPNVFPWFHFNLNLLSTPNLIHFENGRDVMTHLCNTLRRSCNRVYSCAYFSSSWKQCARFNPAYALHKILSTSRPFSKWDKAWNLDKVYIPSGYEYIPLAKTIIIFIWICQVMIPEKIVLTNLSLTSRGQLWIVLYEGREVPENPGFWGHTGCCILMRWDLIRVLFKIWVKTWSFTMNNG